MFWAVLCIAIPNFPRRQAIDQKANWGTKTKLADYLLLHPFIQRSLPHVLYTPYRIVPLSNPE